MQRRTLVGFLLAGILLIASFAHAAPKITDVRSEKVCYRPGQTAMFRITLSNAGEIAAKGRLVVDVLHGLDEREPVGSQPVALEAKTQKQLEFTWPVPSGRKWGHEVRARLLGSDGRLLSELSETFTVGHNPWEVGHYRTLFGIRGCKNSGRIEKVLMPGFRNAYVTCIEAYSWQPSVFDEMSPDMETWVSGQGNYREGKEDWQYLVRLAHQNGMSVVTYIQSISYGVCGLEFVRRHPRWMPFTKDGNMVGWFNVDKLALAHADPENVKGGTFGGWAVGAFINTDVGEYWIEEVMRSTEMFGWDGFRSDGTPMPSSGYDYRGDHIDLAGKDEKARVSWTEHIRRRLRERYPGFVFGWNHRVHTRDWKVLEPSFHAAYAKGSYMLWEGFRGSPQPTSPLHDWKKMVEGLHRECEWIAEHGGFSHVGWMASNRYLEAIVSACGAQVDTWSVVSPYRRFEVRYGGYLWDNALARVAEPDRLVSVKCPPHPTPGAELWWRDFVWQRDIPSGKRRLIIHLINQPAGTDDAWNDSPPAPLKSIEVSFRVPRERAARVFWLSPDNGEGFSQDLEVVRRGDFAVVTIPQLVVWDVIVAEF